ncbi:unnamed protein product [Brassica rapa subsp. trilocularis]
MLISYLLHCLQNILMFLIRLFYYSQISPLILLRYYDDAACVLRKMCLDAKAPHLSSTLPPTLPWKFNKHVQPNKGLTRQGNGNSEELRCVIAVIRHYVFLAYKSPLSPLFFYLGDRTPKQKVKLIVTQEKLLNLMLKYNGGKPRAEVREAPAFLSSIFYQSLDSFFFSFFQLQDLLDATRMLVPRTRPGRESDSDPEDLEHAEKLRQVKAVIEEVI